MCHVLQGIHTSITVKFIHYSNVNILQAIRLLVLASTDLQKEIVESGKVKCYK